MVLGVYEFVFLIGWNIGCWYEIELFILIDIEEGWFVKYILRLGMLVVDLLWIIFFCYFKNVKKYCKILVFIFVNK